MVQMSTQALSIDVAEIDARVDAGWSLPTRFYSDPAIFDFEMEAIFARAWQFFCPVQQVMNPGDVAVRRIGRWPIVVIRDRDGRLRGLLNICRHRGYTVAERDQSKCARLVCRYHAWSYHLDGRLANAPDADGETEFCKDDLGLIPVAVDTFGSAVFVNPDAGARPMPDVMPELFASAHEVGCMVDPARYAIRRTIGYDIATNWKLWYDNGAECYHCPVVHGASFSEDYDPSPTANEVAHGPGFMRNIFPPSTQALARNPNSTGYRSFQVFPGYFVAMEGDLMQLSSMHPVAPDLTHHETHYLMAEGGDPDEIDRAIEVWDRTYSEDNAITAVQHTNLAAGRQPWNRYVAGRERNAIHFSDHIWQLYKTALAA